MREEIKPITEKPIKLPEKVTFNEETFTLLLNVSESDVELDKIKEIAEKNNFKLKTDFHITAIGYKIGKKIRSILEKNIKAKKRPEVQENLKQLIANTSWKYSLSPNIVHIKKDYRAREFGTTKIITLEERESYTRIIEVPEIENFYKQLNLLFGTTFAVPPMHITLCTAGTNPETSQHGVGLYSASELNSCAKETIEA